jgi:hypothetical protein
MRSHPVDAAFSVVLVALMAACDGSKSSDRRDGAVPASDSSTGEDTGSDVALPDGPSLGPDTALPDGPLWQDGNRQEAVRDVASMDTASAKGDALESGRDSVGTSADGTLAAFCSGADTRSMVNGTEGAPTVRVSRIATGCCDGFQLELNSATFASPIFVAAISSGVSFVPVDIDLSNPPDGWTFRVSGVCETSSESSCKEQFDSGFVGTFRTAWVEDSTAIDLSVCLHVEDVDGSHQLFRSFDLSIPHSVAN